MIHIYVQDIAGHELFFGVYNFEHYLPHWLHFKFLFCKKKYVGICTILGFQDREMWSYWVWGINKMTDTTPTKPSTINIFSLILILCFYSHELISTQSDTSPDPVIKCSTY